MVRKISTLVVVIIIVSVCQSFGAFPGKAIQMRRVYTQTFTDAARGEFQKPFVFGSTYESMAGGRKCYVSKVGRGMLVVGGTMVVIGFVYGLANSTNNNFEGLDTGLTFVGTGLTVALVGGLLAIGGGIYNHTGSRRYSLVAPRSNEVGFAWRF